MAATLDENLVPSTGALMGAIVHPRQGRDHEEETLFIEQEMGRGLDTIRNFHRWDSPVIGSAEKECRAGGRIPMTNLVATKKDLSVVPWQRIAMGYEDTAIDAHGALVKQFGTPVFFIFHHEPEDDIDTHGTPTNFRNAFRRIRRRWDAAGITNVVYMIDFMAWTFNDRSGRDPDEYDPGPTVVDWYAANTFNWYPGRPGSRWQTLEFLATPFYLWATREHPGMPLAIGASGCQEDPAQPSRKGEWHQEASACLEGWPEFKLWNYYNAPIIYPWWFDTTEPSLEGFRVAVDQHFNPQEKPAPTSIEPAEVFDESDQEEEPPPAEPPDESFDDGE